MDINISQLQNIISLMMKSLKERYGDDVELQNDFYWNISSDEIYNVSENPKSLTIGQITDDFFTLKNAFNTDSLTPYDLQRVANILKAISIEYPI
jgi:hypothetical protein